MYLFGHLCGCLCTDRGLHPRSVDLQRREDGEHQFLKKESRSTKCNPVFMPQHICYIEISENISRSLPFCALRVWRSGMYAYSHVSELEWVLCVKLLEYCLLFLIIFSVGQQVSLCHKGRGKEVTVKYSTHDLS